MSDAIPTPPPAKPPLPLALLYWVRDLMFSVVLAVFVILFLYQPVKVEGTSMMPALVDQERIFINKFSYKLGLGKVERGDMVVFWFPADPDKPFIKRVIGVPGDRVEVDAGTVVLNGRRLAEPYVPEEYRDQQSMLPLAVGRDEYFVMGDHRSMSNDSRAWGAVHRKHIYGKAVFVYWPLAKLGLVQ